MSDRVTNVEIEDVLSSIRRLVADHDAAPRAADGAAPDRLILTPALRVAPLRLEPAPVEGEGEGEDENGSGGGALGQAGPQADPAATVSLAAPADESAGVVARLAARIEAAIKGQAEDFEPDGSEEVPVMDWSPPAAEDVPVFRSRATAPLRLHSDAVADVPVFQHRGPDKPALRDRPGDDSGLRASPHPDADPPEDDAIDPELAALFGQEIMVDEAMLRNLVVEVVRQELQGALGERITRNVRKLVRREIHRVITSQELD